MSDVTNAEMGRWLARIEAKLDKAIDDHEHRLRTVERWVYGLPPTFLLAVASLIVAYLRGG